MTAIAFQGRGEGNRLGTSRPSLILILWTLVILSGIQSVSFAQEEEDESQRKSREIVSEDFTRNRPATAASKPVSGPDKKSSSSSKANAGQASGIRRKRRIYRPVSTSNKETSTTSRPASSPSTTTNPGSAALTVEQVGITIWRLRSATATDDGPKISAYEDGSLTWWTAERLTADARLSLGERVRLSIESPRTGYLYVIDREQYRDGTLGPPMLIFPTTRARGGDNRVRAGLLIDIPAQEDDMPYFTLRSNRSDYVGDLLSVIVAPQPIEGLTLGRQPMKIPPAQLAMWEQQWNAQVERFELEAGDNSAWTPEEKDAGRVSGRSLTQDEPSPQTIYSVATKPGSPFMVSVRLSASP